MKWVAICFLAMFLMAQCQRISLLEGKVEYNETHFRCEIGRYSKEHCDIWRDDLRKKAGLPPATLDPR